MAWTDPAIWTTGSIPAPTDALPVVSITDATAYFLKTPRNAEWVALTDQQIWLNEAQKYLGQLCFDQDADCCGRVFTEEWIAAVSELALALSKNPTAIIGGGASASAGAVKRNKLGDLEQEFFAPGESNQGSKYGPNAPKVLQAFPWLGDILGCWLNVATGTSRVISRCC